MIHRLFAVVLVVSLVGMCLVEIVHAAMPQDGAMDCATQLCNEQSGCASTGAIALPGLPVALMSSLPVLAAPGTTVQPAVVTQSTPPSKRHLLPSAPRSPPLA